MKKFLLLLCISITYYCADVSAAHIIGGKFRVSYINANRIKIELQLERDCAGGGAPFETIVNVGLYNKSTNSTVLNFSLNRDYIIKSPYNYDCKGINRCFELANYSTILNTNTIFDFNSTGYYLQWERCCLTNQLVNVLDPGGTPFSALIEIPRLNQSPTDTTNFVNSSPFKKDIFDPLVCLNYDFEYDFGFTDNDGDSLVYELITPIAGGYTSAFNPGQNTGPAPYDSIIWAIGFSANNFITSNTPISLDYNTGKLSFKPSVLGKYQFAIAVHEYRNSMKIGTVYYQSILNVYNCTSVITSQPIDQYSIDYAPVTFRVKHSDSTVTYQWQYRPSDSVAFENIQNANSDSLSLSNIVDFMNNYQYRCIMYKDSCNDISIAAKLHIINTGIFHTNRQDLKVFPNPSSNQITITGIEHPIKLSLYSLTGILLKEVFNTSVMEVSDILPGMYIIRATDQQNNPNYFAKLRIGE